jgi:hypothetical protein
MYDSQSGISGDSAYEPAYRNVSWFRAVEWRGDYRHPSGSWNFSAEFIKTMRVRPCCDFHPPVEEVEIKVYKSDQVCK